MNIICKNCGSEVALPDGMKEGFCGNCGTKVEAAAADENTPNSIEDNDTAAENTPVVEDIFNTVDSETTVENTASDVENTSKNVEKNETIVETFEPEADAPAADIADKISAKDKLTGKIDGVIASLPPSLRNIRLLAIITAVVICLAIGFVIGILIGILSGNGSYKSAESKTFDALTAINNFGGISDGYSTEFDFTYSLSEDIKGIYSEFLSEDTDEISAEGIISVFGNSALADITGHAFTMDARAVGTFNGNEATIAFPDATSYVYYYNLSESDGENIVTLNQNAFNKTVKAIEKEYFKIANRSYEVEKNDELKGGKIKVKADKYTFKFTREDTLNFALYAIEQVRKNDNFMEYVSQTSPRYKDGYESFEDDLDDLESMIDDELFDLSDSEKESTYFRMKAWVYRGNVISREIDNIYGAEDVEISYTFLANTKAAYIKASFRNDYNENKITGDLSRTGKYWDGDLRLNLNNDDISAKLSVKDITLSGKYLTGKATLKGTFGYSDLDIDFDFNKADNSQQITIDGILNTDDLGRLTLTYNTKKISSLKLPVYDEEDLIDYSAIYSDDETYEKNREMNEELRDYFF
ncbi:MAG: zinc ribbon domain-containing protein [Ruminococcus sp.]|jgi:hypothetical protein|nr:zinc ribbon domain-containing protein [Ruminococcus sp.]